MLPVRDRGAFFWKRKRGRKQQKEKAVEIERKHDKERYRQALRYKNRMGAEHRYRTQEIRSASGRLPAGEGGAHRYTPRNAASQIRNPLAGRSVFTGSTAALRRQLPVGRYSPLLASPGKWPRRNLPALREEAAFRGWGMSPGDYGGRGGPRLIN